MVRIVNAALAVAVLASAAQPAPVNLVVNGDFELAPTGKGLVNGNAFAAMPEASGNRSWDVWQTVPGWTTAAGNGIEVQTRRTIGNADPQSGDFYVELDSHPRSGGDTTMAQSLTLDAGSYRLAYWYMPRTDNPNDNGLAVFFGGNEVAEHDASAKTQAGWVQFFANIEVGKSGDYLLAFAATGLENSLGALVDNVSLTQTPLPAALPLMAAGLAGLAVWRRRRA